MNRAERLAGITERRGCTQPFELRAIGGNLTFEGYASLFDEPYDMFGWTETVDPKAFDRTLSLDPDVPLLIGHEGLPLARTTSSTLELRADDVGLFARATLNPDDPDVQRIRPKMARRDLTQMSFAFRTIRQEWTEDESERRLLEVSLDRGDVSIVTHGAQPLTTSTIRSLPDALALLRDLDADKALVEVRALSDVDPVAALNEARAAIDVLLASLRPEGRTTSVKRAKRVLALTA